MKNNKIRTRVFFGCLAHPHHKFSKFVRENDKLYIGKNVYDTFIIPTHTSFIST